MKWGPSLILSILFLASCKKADSGFDNQSQQPLDSISTWVGKATSSDFTISEKQQLLQKALAFNNRLPENAARAKNLSKISIAYADIGDSTGFRIANRGVIALSKKIGSPAIEGEAHWDLGLYIRREKPDSAYYHYKEAFQLFSIAELPEDKMYFGGRVLESISELKENIKDYAGAEKEITKAIKEYKRIGSTRHLFGAYNQLGIVENGLMNFDKAIEYHEKAREYIPFVAASKQVRFRLINMNNIASAHLRQGENQIAYELFLQLEKFANSNSKSSFLYRKAISSKAITGFKSGNLSTKDASSMIEFSIRKLDSMGKTYDLARNFQYLAEIQIASMDTLSSIKNSLKAKEIAEATSNFDRLQQILGLLVQIDKNNSHDYGNQYIKLSNRLQREERNIQDKFARIQLETDEIIEENEVLAKERQLYLGVAIGILVLGLAIISIVILRIKNQRLKFKQKQQEANEEIYNLMLAQQGKIEEGKKAEQKRVSEELHDGILGQMLGIRLIMSGLNDRHDDEAVGQRADLIKKLQEVEEEVRTISHELNASAYEKLDNFIIAIKELVLTVGTSAKIKTSFEHDQSFHWDALTGDLKINSYRVVQECLQNCVKHANGNHIFVKFEGDAKQIQLTIEDDGDGFDINKGKKGIGLKNIISRVKKMKGTLEINSELGKGTIMTIKLPTDFVLPGNPKSESVRTSVVEA